MLPKNPRMGGLPPRPKPRSAVPSSEISEVPSSGPSRMRPPQNPRKPQSQKSFNSQPLSRNPGPPAQEVSAFASRGSSLERDRHRQSNESSSSSSSSSFLERVKPRYSSSETSLEDLDRQSYRSEVSKSEVASGPLQNTLREQSPSLPQSGDGSAIWNRVAAVANTLTISVGKAWAANIMTDAGEETPPGEESRLLRAMKAYHLDKATTPSDLPEWLFSAKERNERAGSRLADGVSDDRYNKLVVEPPSMSSGGLRHIYDAVAAPSDRPYNRAPRSASNTAPPSKATDRLRAMREAKRGLGANAESEETDAKTSNGEATVTRPRPRIGLPSGPRRG